MAVVATRDATEVDLRNERVGQASATDYKGEVEKFSVSLFCKELPVIPASNPPKDGFLHYI